MVSGRLDVQSISWSRITQVESDIHPCSTCFAGGWVCGRLCQVSILPRHVISLDKSCQVVLIPWHTALAGYAARYGYHLDIITGLLVYTHSTQQPHACVCVPLPSSQSAHTRQGCGSLRRRVLSECRVLARLEASPVTRLLGMERNRQGATQGLPGLQAWRAGWPGGRKGAFRDSLFQDSFATTPFALPFPTLPPRAAASAGAAAAACVPRAWYCMARYGHGVTHATVTHSEGHLGSGLTSSGLHGGTPPADDMSCTLLHEHTGPSPGSCQPSPPRPVRLHRERRGRDPGNLGTDHVHWKSDESVIWPPTPPPLPLFHGVNVVLSVAGTDFFHRIGCMRTSCQSPSGRTAGSHSSRISKTKTPASGLRQALLGRIRFGKPPSLGYVRQKRGRASSNR